MGNRINQTLVKIKAAVSDITVNIEYEPPMDPFSDTVKTDLVINAKELKVDDQKVLKKETWDFLVIEGYLDHLLSPEQVGQRKTTWRLRTIAEELNKALTWDPPINPDSETLGQDLRSRCADMNSDQKRFISLMSLDFLLRNGYLDHLKSSKKARQGRVKKKRRH